MATGKQPAKKTKKGGKKSSEGTAKKPATSSNKGGAKKRLSTKRAKQLEEQRAKKAKTVVDEEEQNGKDENEEGSEDSDGISAPEDWALGHIISFKNITKSDPFNCQEIDCDNVACCEWQAVKSGQRYVCCLDC